MLGLPFRQGGRQSLLVALVVGTRAVMAAGRRMLSVMLSRGMSKGSTHEPLFYKLDLGVITDTQHTISRSFSYVNFNTLNPLPHAQGFHVMALAARQSVSLY